MCCNMSSTSTSQAAVKKLYKVAVLTVSDSRHKGLKEDVSGNQIESLLIKGDIFPSHKTVQRATVPDERLEIERVLSEWADSTEFDLIFTIGGTGFSPRDVTPEATKWICERQAPALAQAVISLCSIKTPLALLSRSRCGIRRRTIIFNLPGSANGSRECFVEVAKVLPHAIDQVKGDAAAVEQFHMNIQDPSDGTCRKSKVNISRVAQRHRISPYKMVSSGDALNVMISHCYRTEVKETLIENSVGFVSASDVRAKFPSPPFRASIKDGYAVLSADGKGLRQVLGVLTAGDDPSVRFLAPGGCIRVSTGSPVPLNSDCVVQVEDTVVTKMTEEGDQEIEINVVKEPTPGQDIRKAGVDINFGQIVVAKNKEISSFDCGVMAAAGINSVPVYRTPSVVILSTGDELVKVGEDLKPGCIFDANSSVLQTILSKWGIEYTQAGIAKDNPDHLLAKLVLAFNKGDVIIITGGMSMGEKDYVKDVLLEDFGAEMHFGRIHMKPGKPTAFFTVMSDGKKKLVFCLPGNPVSAAVTFHLFVLPCLRKMMGHSNITQLTMEGKLASDVLLDPRPEYHRVLVSWEQGGKPVARSTGNQRSSRMLSFSDSNGLMLLPPCTAQKAELKAGSNVLVMLFDYFAPGQSSFYM